MLGSITANSAFHGTRLDVRAHQRRHGAAASSRPRRRGVRREDIAGETVFISHETYTPARGGSAAAEIHALREVFGEDADRIVIANVKGYTGHPMGVGLEDVLAVKALETGIVPPVPNFRDPDPELGVLNLSGGGAYPVRYSLRLAAGFGSQITMLLLRWTPVADGRRRNVDELGYDVPDRRSRGLEGLAAAGERLRGPASRGRPAPAARRRSGSASASRWTRPPAGRPATAAAIESRPCLLRARRRAAPRRGPRLRAGSDARAVPPGRRAGEVAPPRRRSPTGDVAARVLEVVAEQTGYPTELLDMDLDLEADLGIDTVKQAEVFADDPRDLWDRARRRAQAARLPDPQPRRRRSSTSARPSAAPRDRRRRAAGRDARARRRSRSPGARALAAR